MEIHRKDICSSSYVISVSYSAVPFFFLLYLLTVHVSCIFLSRIYLRPFHRLLLSSQMLEAYNAGIIQGHTHPP